MAVGTGLMIALIAGAGLPGVSSTDFQFEAQGTVTGWEAVLNYDVNANWTNITDYWVDGDFSDVITCDVDWLLVTNETTSTDRGNQRQYALDYDEGELGFLQVKNGSQTKKVLVCSSFGLEPVGAASGDWTTHEDCRAGGPNGEEAEETDVVWAVHPDRWDAETVTDEEAGHCITAFAADTDSYPDRVPYTGTVEANLTGPDGEVHNTVRMKAIGGYKFAYDEVFSDDDDQASGFNSKVYVTNTPLLRDDVKDIPGTGSMKARAET